MKEATEIYTNLNMHDVLLNMTDIRSSNSKIGERNHEKAQWYWHGSIKDIST